ncbi:hypothetical protein OHC33_011262 [Knufia fluminis]|uniref:Uncharacterized protein n=1 Tax=Knufia fluminis TaxID=191047 RepID=A0AAN8E796_9EURO|nr:hypothetical protein OHC33_011262 [Knufia fluminis]
MYACVRRCRPSREIPTEAAPVFEDVSEPEPEPEPEPEFAPEPAEDITPVVEPAEDVTSTTEPASDTVDLPGVEAVDEDGPVNAASTVSEYDHEDVRGHKTPSSPNTEQNIFLSCITCTRMILIVFRGDCPFSTLKLFHNPGVSMMAFTTCRKCVKDCRQRNKDAELFGREAEIALSNLHMSPKIITNSYLYKIASTIAPTGVNVLQDRCEVKYYPMHGVLDEMTDVCMIMGVLTDESAEMKKEKLLMPFVPGAFL